MFWWALFRRRPTTVAPAVGRRALTHVAVLVLCTSVALGAMRDAMADASLPASREYLIKAAFLYDMLQVVGWPRQEADGLRLCVLGKDKFGAAWRSIEGKPVAGRGLVIQHTRQIPALSGCDVLFIGDSESGRLPELIALVAERPVLTVSELPRFAEQGGIVRLREANNKLRFDINAAAARRAGIVVPIEVMQLANVIGDGEGTPQQGQR